MRNKITIAEKKFMVLPDDMEETARKQWKMEEILKKNDQHNR